MFKNLLLFPLRLSAVVGLLAACLAVDAYRKACPFDPDKSKPGRTAIDRREPGMRRMAYLGVLALSLVGCTIVALARLHRV